MLLPSVLTAATGQLLTKAPLDFETKDTYAVSVSVSDGKGGTDSISVTIYVTDLFENNPPVFTEGDSTSTFHSRKHVCR